MNPTQIAAEICKAVAELPDRDSPEDWPEAMIVTHVELDQIVREALASTPAVPDSSADPVDEMDFECDMPPFGWRCTRGKGHEGPCAAVQAPDDIDWMQRGMARLREAEQASAPRAASGSAEPDAWLAEQFTPTGYDGEGAHLTVALTTNPEKWDGFRNVRPLYAGAPPFQPLSTPVAATTWGPVGENDSMRHFEDSDIRGGETDMIDALPPITVTSVSTKDAAPAALKAEARALMGDEYQRWINFYHAGDGDYADFLKADMNHGITPAASKGAA